MADSGSKPSAKPESKALPYRLRKHFLSTSEVALNPALLEMAGQHYYGCMDNPHCPGMVPISNNSPG